MRRLESIDIEIRKLRKKLRQIETLEELRRELTDEEKTKVSVILNNLFNAYIITPRNYAFSKMYSYCLCCLKRVHKL